MTSAIETPARRPGPVPGSVRSPHVIGIVVQLAHCSVCGASGPENPCVRPLSGADGMHVARYAAARRRDLITSEEFGSVIWALRAFTNATVVYDETFGQAA